MVTLLDVAASAGVSRSTVSLVINKSPLVKDETRQRVERAIQELGYVPNPNARGLVKKENKSYSFSLGNDLKIKPIIMSLLVFQN